MPHQFNPSAAMPEASMSALRKDLCQVRGTQHFYYPLTAKTASISLSNLRGSNLGFDAFCGKFKKLHKKDSSQSGDYYRKHGKCLMTISSYRKVHPINIDYKCVAAMTAVAIATKLTSQPQLRQILMIGAMAEASNLEYKWVSAIMTANATNLISEPKLRIILALGILALTMNFQVGMMQEHSTHIFTAVHATTQLLLFIGHLVFTPKTSMVYTLGASILGLALGSMAEQSATISSKPNSVVGGSSHLPQPPPDRETEASVDRGSYPATAAPCYDIFLKVALLLWSFLPLYFP